MDSSAEPPEGVSSSDVPDRPGLVQRLYDEFTDKVSRQHPWYTLPEVAGLAELIGIRDTLRQQNLFDTSRLPSVDPAQPPPYDESYLAARTADGSWNDLEHPEMGMAGTRFGRNVPLDDTWPDQDRMMTPNPREISRRLMTRDTFNPATAGNALITAWLQFMLHDWVKHGTSPTDNPWVLPEVQGDDWPAPPVVVMRVPPDPTAPADSALPPTHLNVNTHWWDGSSIYGNDLAQQRFLREGAGGRLRLVDGLPPVPPDPQDNPALVPGFWLGLGMMQTLFSLEHNSIAAMLAAAHPDFDDETLFQKARLTTCALIAKIHTVEWTPAVTAHPTAVEGLYANWWGLAGPKLHNFVGQDFQERGAARHPRHRHRRLWRAVRPHRGIRRHLPDAPAGAGRLRLPVGPRRCADARATVVQRADRAAGRPHPAGPAADRHHLHLRHDEPGPGHAAQLPDAGCRRSGGPTTAPTWIWRRWTSCAAVSSGCRGTASSAACCTCPCRRPSRR